MPIYKIEFISNLQKNGWTEQHFRQSGGSPELASNVLDFVQTSWQRLHPPGATFESCRASDVAQPFMGFLREIDIDGLTFPPVSGQSQNGPDVTATCAQLNITLADGTRVRSYLRGMRDAWTIRLNSGQLAAMGQLRQAVNQYGNALVQSGYGTVRRRRAGETGFPKHALASAAPSAAGRVHTTFTCPTGEGVPAVGNQIVISRVPGKTLHGANGVWTVVDAAGQTFTVDLLYTSPYDVVYVPRASWRLLGTTFVQYVSATFGGLTKRDVGGPIDVSRGRARATPRRA
jgi:hypothetical protein